MDLKCFKSMSESAFSFLRRFGQIEFSFVNAISQEIFFAQNDSVRGVQKKKKTAFIKSGNAHKIHYCWQLTECALKGREICGN